MKNWLMPGVVLIAVAGAGLGVGWFVNGWQDSDGTSAPVQTGPTQAERGAQRREDDRLCLEAQQAAAAQEAAQMRYSESRRRLVPSGRVDISVLEAIQRYCR